MKYSFFTTYHSQIPYQILIVGWYNADRLTCGIPIELVYCGVRRLGPLLSLQTYMFLLNFHCWLLRLLQQSPDKHELVFILDTGSIEGLPLDQCFRSHDRWRYSLQAAGYIIQEPNIDLVLNLRYKPRYAILYLIHHIKILPNVSTQRGFFHEPEQDMHRHGIPVHWQHSGSQATTAPESEGHFSQNFLHLLLHHKLYMTQALSSAFTQSATSLMITENTRNFFS